MKSRNFDERDDLDKFIYRTFMASLVYCVVFAIAVLALIFAAIYFLVS